MFDFGSKERRIRVCIGCSFSERRGLGCFLHFFDLEEVSEHVRVVLQKDALAMAFPEPRIPLVLLWRRCLRPEREDLQQAWEDLDDVGELFKLDGTIAVGIQSLEKGGHRGRIGLGGVQGAVGHGNQGE